MIQRWTFRVCALLLLSAPLVVFSQSGTSSGLLGGGFPGGASGGGLGLHLGSGMLGAGGTAQNPLELSDEFGDANSLDVNCKAPGSDFACGECETNLQSQFNDLIADITGAPAAGTHWGGALSGKRAIRPGVTLESTLGRIRELLKANNREGDGGLNFIVIGESESLQPSAVRDGKLYPRVALKSPNSELWVTFSTDPTNAAYSTLEIMRWNGKQAKYEFMELDFDPKHRHMDGTGEKCLPCHKEPDPRPNWDTYRAWAGVVPSRDDMLEVGEVKSGIGGLFSSPKLAADGRAYVSFLEQVVDAKERAPQSRLALLDLPIDDEVQFADRVPRVSSLSPRKQLEAIKRQTQQTGFYRIPHFPYKDKLLNQNFDQKTARYTGPSQAAFDQMSGQNFCRISQRLQQHPNYDKFKYLLAGLANQCDIEDLSAWVPESMQQQSLNFFNENQRVRLRNLHLANRTPGQIRSFQQLQERLLEDTQQNHGMADEFKFRRHQRFLESYLTRVENSAPQRAQAEAETFSRIFKTERLDGFHAIDDHGGVKGVPEGHAMEISQVRAVLEPLGLDVGQWSMMRGDDPNYNSLAFSDQFALLFEQPAIKQLLTESTRRARDTGKTVCEYLQTKSVQALVTELPRVAAPAPNDFNVDQWCRDRLGAEFDESALGLTEQMKGLFAIARKVSTERAQALTVQCLSCHGKDGFLPFPGMDQLRDEKVYPSDSPGPWTEATWQQFEAYLLSPVATPSPVVTAGHRGAHFIDKLILGRMPPGGWPHTGSHEEKLRADDERRRFLADYIGMTLVTDPDAQRVLGFCRSLLGSQEGKDVELRRAPEAGMGTGATQR